MMDVEEEVRAPVLFVENIEEVTTPVQETKKLNAGCAHLKASDFLKLSPWVLVENGSMGGVFGELFLFIDLPRNFDQF